MYRGIRFAYLWGRDVAAEIKKPQVMADLKLLSDAGLSLDSGGGEKDVPNLLRISDRIPNLRIIINHLPGAPIPEDPAARARYEQGLRELGKRPQVYVKVSEIFQRVDAKGRRVQSGGRIPRELSFYRPRLDEIWETFGPDRLLFASDWTNSEPMGTFGETLRLVQEYFTQKGPDAVEKFFWKNSLAIYKWVKRAPAQPGGLAQGATVKQWTPAGGIQVVCPKEMGFVNPGNIDVNPADGHLYVCDRAEDDASRTATGLWRIDPGPTTTRTRMTGNVFALYSVPADGQPALDSFIEGTRGIAFLPNGAYFICGHKDGSIWYVDTTGILHRYLRGSGRKDGYVLPDDTHPPLVFQDYFAQPRAVTIGPDGSLIAVSNDSGYVFVVKNVAPPVLPRDLRPESFDSSGLRLGWSGLLGHAYIVERTPSLQPPAWAAIGATSGKAGLTEFVDSSSGSFGRAFYRLSPPR